MMIEVQGCRKMVNIVAAQKVNVGEFWGRRLRLLLFQEETVGSFRSSCVRAFDVNLAYIIV